MHTPLQDLVQNAYTPLPPENLHLPTFRILNWPLLVCKKHWQLQSATKALATMEHTWETGVLLVSLAFFTLSSCSGASIWSEYYNIVKRESSDWKNWANLPCKVFQDPVLKCMNFGKASALVGNNGTHCASCYPIPQGGATVKLSELDCDMYIKNGKFFKCASLKGSFHSK